MSSPYSLAGTVVSDDEGERCVESYSLAVDGAEGADAEDGQLLDFRHVGQAARHYRGGVLIGCFGVGSFLRRSSGLWMGAVLAKRSTRDLLGKVGQTRDITSSRRVSRLQGQDPGA